MSEENTSMPAPLATIATLGQHDGQSVTLHGWLYNLRESGKLLFPIFRDGTGTVQGVAHVKSVSPEVFATLKGLTQESSVKVTGKVRNLTSYGAFVELEEGIDGMVHVSDMSWTRKINHPSERLKKGDEVEATILEVDKANQRIALGMKQLEIDPWEKIETLYKVGDLVQGKVTKLASFGAFVGLQHEIDGLVHISQISEERVEKIKNVLKVGQDVSARVVKIDRNERRIGLSIKAAAYSDEQLKEEQKMLDALKPGEDLVALQHAFDALDDVKVSDKE